MGLIGWADAPSTDSNNDIEIKPPAPKTVSSQGFFSNVEVIENQSNDLSANDSELIDESNEKTYLDEASVKNDQNPDLPSDLADVTDKQQEEIAKSVQDELFSVIAKLQLREGSSNNLYDISKIELHEVLFVLDHVIRTETLDYYRLARAIHLIKRQLLNLEISPDSIESPNLDELVEYVEKQYRENLDGE